MTLLSRNLARAAYEGVAFPVIQCTTSHGHDSVKHMSYRVSGVDNETTGLRASTGKIRVALSGDIKAYGELFPGLFQRLKDTFKRSPIGLLTHPTLGLLEVHIDQWDEDLTPAVTDGLSSFEFSWTEQGSRESDLFESNDSSESSSTGAVSERLAAKSGSADEAVSRAIPTASRRPSPTAPVIETQTSFLESAKQPFNDALGAIREMERSVQTSLNDDGLQSADGFEARFLLADLYVEVRRYAAAYFSSRKVRTFTVPHSMTLSQVAALPGVFGTSKRATELLSSNAILDIFNVQAGTTITIVD